MNCPTAARLRTGLLVAIVATAGMQAVRMASSYAATSATTELALESAGAVTSTTQGNDSAAPQIPFISNEGQYAEAVQFYAPLKLGTVYVTHSGEIHYALSRSLANNDEGSVALRELFVGASVDTVAGEDEAPVRVSYYKESQAEPALTEIPAWDTISFGELYDGIELRLKPVADHVEKQFVVQPAAQPGDIRIAVEGAQSLSTNAVGELEAETEHGTLAFARPQAWQFVDGCRRVVPVSYEVCGLQYGFAFGEYDTALPLFIEPCPAGSPKKARWSRATSEGGRTLVSAADVGREHTEILC